MQIDAILVAAGRGERAGGGIPKQWRSLAGRPVLAHALDAFRRAGRIRRTALVVHPDDLALADPFRADGVLIVEGGATRDASVRAGLEALATNPPGAVLIHDAARPNVSTALIGRVIDALAQHDAAAPAVAVTDALWTGADGLVTGTRDRAGLWRAQTPQGFRYGAILSAHRAHAGGAADDVEVARAAGVAAAIVPGDPDNLKITAPEDFARAERLMGGRAMDVRTGNGFDVHAFGPGDAVVLCGVRIPHARGLAGHSDADVGLHALADAIYGALAEGDIGRHFPPSDDRWKGADSAQFLAHAADLARSRGYAVGNLDVTLICESPKIGPHAAEMTSRISRIADLDTDRVSVKATTSERLGFTGRGEGIAALATATLVRG